MSNIDETYERVLGRAQDNRAEAEGAKQQCDSALQDYIRELEYHRLVSRIAAQEHISQELKAHYLQERNAAADRADKARSLYDNCRYKLEKERLYQRAFDSAVAAMKQLKEEEDNDEG